jgi:hypothetical protein
MNLIQLIVVGMILTILATVTLAVVSYGAFKMRQQRSPVRGGHRVEQQRLFFERVELGEIGGREG